MQEIQVYPENLFLRVILSDPFTYFSLFGLLALLIYRGFQLESELSVPLLKVAFLAIGYGFVIEVYQGILPWRSFGLDDIVWNTVGVLFVVAVVGISRGLKIVFGRRWTQIKTDSQYG